MNTPPPPVRVEVDCPLESDGTKGRTWYRYAFGADGKELTIYHQSDKSYRVIADSARKMAKHYGVPLRFLNSSKTLGYRTMSIRTFIKKHRAEIDETIRSRVPNIGRKLNDEERRLWVLNDWPLYLWARREHVRI